LKGSAEMPELGASRGVCGNGRVIWRRKSTGSIPRVDGVADLRSARRVVVMAADEMPLHAAAAIEFSWVAGNGSGGGWECGDGRRQGSSV